MLDVNKNYWLYIAPYVYCCIKDTQALLYNTRTNASMETISPEILALLQTLHEKRNLGAAFYEGKTLVQEAYLNFVTEFCQKGMGGLIDVAQMPEKPIQLMPVLNLQRDVEKLQQEKERYVGEDVLRYLLELNLYIHDNCQQNCPFCKNYFRQSLCCRTSKQGTQPGTMDIHILRNTLSQIQYGVVGKINLLGGNIWKYPHYEELPEMLADFKERVHIWNHYANFIDGKTIFADFKYDVPVTFPVNENAWNRCIALFEDIEVKYHFLITGTDEYEKAEALIAKHKLNQYAIQPVYTTANRAFFEEYIYTDSEDIFQSKLAFRQIFAHQKLNTYFFGSLTVLPDGKVYANINCPALGSIPSNTLLEIISKEMLVNTAWRKIRDAAPCSDCLYQYLCPSPSNYEIVIGKPNLCQIK